MEHLATFVQHFAGGILKPPLQWGTKIRGTIIRYLKVKRKIFCIGPRIFIKERKRNHRLTKRGKILGLHNALTIHECVQQSNKSCPLAWKILNIQHLKSSKSRCSQCHLDIGLITSRGPDTRSLVKSISLFSHSSFLKALFKDFKIPRFKNARVFGYFPEIRVNLKLSRFMADHGKRTIPDRFFVAGPR